ncbi:MAG: phosphatidate cytidylyltransferase [Collinsella sp.]|nr:phosphatidate cytidylyltransferase [Collinsella sp.]
MDSQNRKAASSASPDAAAQRKDSALNKLLIRSGFGIVYAALFILCLLFGKIPTAILIAIMSWLCCHEFFRMTRIDGKVPNELIGLSAAVLFPLSALGAPVLLTAVLFLLVVAVGLWYLFSPRARLSDIAVTLFGPIYTGFMLSAIVLTRGALDGFPGALLSIGVCASLWINDSFAYLVGSRFGRHKLAPKISPKKSWEGFIGGIVGSMLVWTILYLTGFYRLNLPMALACGFCIALLGVFGDLIESRIKRGVGVKDSGDLIPGHGGMLDRTDSLIFGCIAAHLALMIGGVI